MNPRSFLATSLAAVVLTTAGAAWADPPPFQARAEGTRVGLSVDLWPTQDFFVATMGVNAQIGVTKNIGIDIDVPWWVGHVSVADPEGQGGTSALFGNITLGAHAVFRVLPEGALNFGASISIPTRYSLTNASASLDSLFAVAALSRGFYDMWRLFPETLFIRFPIGFEVRFLDFLYYRGELTPSILVPVGQDDNLSTQAILEQGDEIEARAPFGLGGGVRFQMAFLLTDELSSLAALIGSDATGTDHLQTAIEPFVGYEPHGSGLYARLGMLVGLDTPLGPGSERDKLMTVRMQVGGKF